ncbi:MAG: DUF4129 domain-containing protein [Siphonobacter sp.]
MRLLIACLRNLREPLGFCLLSLLLGFSAWAGPDTTGVGSKELPVEHSLPIIRKPDPEQWADIKSDRDYHYDRDLQPPSGLLEELWQRFLQWIFEFLYSSENRQSREWIQIIFVVVIVGFVIYRFLGMEKMGLFRRKSKSLTLSYETLHEDIHQIDFQEAINQAIDQQNYRLAVRLLYLRSLKELSEHELISWQINKTNRTYVYEVTHVNFRRDFEQLTSLFEYVWYGDFPVSAERYQEIQQKFEIFHLSLAKTV